MEFLMIFFLYRHRGKRAEAPLESLLFVFFLSGCIHGKNRGGIKSL